MAFVTIDDAVQTTERWRFGLDFVDRMPAGIIIASLVSVTVYNQAGENVTDTIMLSNSEQIDEGDTAASAEFYNFVDGQTYKATFVVTLSNGQTREGDLQIPCKNT